MNCFKRKKRKPMIATPGFSATSSVPLQRHACCCCCKGVCTNQTFRTEFNGNVTQIQHGSRPENHPAAGSSEDGPVLSKRSGTVRITDSDSDKASENCYTWIARTRTISSDSVQGEVAVDEPFEGIVGSKEISYMPVSKDDPYYNMNHPRRGKAVIFNFDHWDNTTIPELGLSPRKGSAKDKADLTETLMKLDFEVLSFESCDSLEMWDILHKLRDEDHSDADCLVVVIMTHGERNTVFVRDGTQIPVNLIWEAFEANKCPSLAGKPKIFIIQACRGRSYDSGTMLSESRQMVLQQVTDVTDSATFSYVIPNSADFLIAFSCPLGHYSWRNPQLGSWFIQSICKIFDRDAYSMDVQSLFTEVARDVALNYESNTTHHASDKKKQVTSTSSTLIRKIIFKPKLHLTLSKTSVLLLNGNTYGDEIDLNIEDLRIISASTQFLTESRL